jgi:hypothetical protein
MKPKLYLHIGTHKTGTTTIQRFLKEKAESLKSKGIVWIPNLKNTRTLKTCTSVDSQLINECKKELKLTIARYGQNNACDSYLMSYEGLSGSPYLGYTNSNLIAKQLAEITNDFDVKIIVYLRKQDDFVESMYTQLIHIGESLTFNEFLESLPVNAFNWQTLLANYSEYFGEENIIVKRYGKSFLPEKNSLIEGFLECFDADIGVLPQSKKAKSHNKGYSRDALEIARLSNAYLSNEEKERLHTLLSSVSAKEAFTSYNYFDDTARLKFFKQFKEPNSKIARKYFGEDGDNLFPSSVSNGSYYNGLTAEAMCPIIIKALVKKPVIESSYLLKLLVKIEHKILSLFGKK